MKERSAMVEGISTSMSDLSKGFDPEFIISKSTKLSIKDILAKICVGPPYFAFKEVYNYQDLLIAPIEPEQGIGFEVDFMSSAEASRHMAILGSCAISLDEDKKKYYLSTKAEFDSCYTRGDKYFITPPSDKKFYVVSKKISISKSFAISQNFLFCGKRLIFSFRVTYQVMVEKLFERVFSSFKSTTSYIEESPYKIIPKLTIISIDKKTLTAEIPTVDKELCAGHFDNHPMLPVGVSAYMVIDLIGELIRKIRGDREERFIIDQATMNVFLPLSIDGQATVRVDLIKEEGDIAYFKWIVFKGDLKFNEMSISFFKVL